MDDKLVRYYIPKIIEENGARAIGYVAGELEYRNRLIDKLVEEVQESKSIECKKACIYLIPHTE